MSDENTDKIPHLSANKPDEMPADAVRVTMPFAEADQEVLYQSEGQRWIGSLKTGDADFDKKDYSRKMEYSSTKYILKTPELMQWISLDRTVNSGCINQLNYNDWKKPTGIW